MFKDDLGDRMKMYETQSESRLLPMLPTFARVDGRAFHTFTRGMKRPYDSRMSEAMRGTALFLARETGATLAYTQSDEITVMWYSPDYKSQIWFDGRHSKMVSQIAALATLEFYRECLRIMPERAHMLPTFDARVWQVPSKTEACNVFLWREQDATRNSLSMAAQSLYSHRELHGKTGADKQEMLHAKGVNWNDYPAFFKRGTYIQRRKTVRPFTVEELDKLPGKHEARRNPGLTVERTEWGEIDIPPLGSVVNREAVVFGYEEPMDK